MRWLPLLGISLFYLLGIGFRVAYQAVRYGGSGIALFRESGLGVGRDIALVLFGAVFPVQALVAAIQPQRLALVELPDGARIAGFALLLLATALMVAAQLDLGASWRIGIDPEAKPGLVTGGLYRFSRNPIFSAMLLAFVGYALALPTYLSFGLLVAGWIGTRLQVRAEEEYLARVYGDEYRAYGRRVGRFVPWIGRL